MEHFVQVENLLAEKVKKLYVLIAEKRICVSQKKCIKDLKVWYNGEDEVI